MAVSGADWPILLPAQVVNFFLPCTESTLRYLPIWLWSLSVVPYCQEASTTEFLHSDRPLSEISKLDAAFSFGVSPLAPSLH